MDLVVVTASGHASASAGLAGDGRIRGEGRNHDRAGLADLAAQLAHVHVDRARVARERVAPHALEQLVARQHEAAVVEQLPQQVELLRRELDLLVADARLAAPGIEVTVAARSIRPGELVVLTLTLDEQAGGVTVRGKRGQPRSKYRVTATIANKAKAVSFTV